MGRRVHLDHNATTPMRAEAREAFISALESGLGNASSVHASGRRARALIDEARERIAGALGVPEDDVVFTSGGTESNNIALFGAVEAGPPDLRVITSSIEHAAVREPVMRLEACGHAVTWIDPERDGKIPADTVAEAAAKGPALVSLMGANNEVGSTTDLARVRAAVGDQPGVVLHSDAVQCLGKLELSDLLASVDMASFSAHKVGGPIGVGLLVKRTGVALAPRVFGGSQEAELRPGTENVAAIAAAAVAIELAVQETEDFATRLRPLAANFWTHLRNAVPDVHLNGPSIDDPERLPNTLNVSFPSHGDARMLVTRFDLAGLEVSAGSACASGSLEPSHVLAALHADRARAVSAIRFSLGHATTAEDVHIAVDTLRITLGEAS